MSKTSGRMRWMTSATLRAWGLSGVERSWTSWPWLPRLREALKVANRIAEGSFGAVCPEQRADQPSKQGIYRGRWSFIEAPVGLLDFRRRVGSRDLSSEDDSAVAAEPIGGGNDLSGLQPA